ncbi:MAG: sodium:calcium antiporter [Alphaproteobacteria bacterium]
MEISPLPAPLAALAAAQPTLFWPVALVVSLALLMRGAEHFTDAAETVGRAAGLSAFVVGVVIVAFGTSLPELVASVLAVVRDASEIVMGNVLGSNIANLGLVLGLGAMVAGRLEIHRQLGDVDLPLLAAATLLVTLMAIDGRVVRLEAALLLGALAVYVRLSLCGHGTDALPVPGDAGPRPTAGQVARALVLLVVSGAVIWLGAEGTVRAVVAIAVLFAIPTETIAATAVAIGTSLPEVAVTLLAARRGRLEMATGNIIGSNVFNLLAVTGVAGLVGPLVVPTTLVVLALPTMAGITVVAMVMLATRAVSRGEGAFLLVIYAWFLLAVTGLAS